MKTYLSSHSYIRLVNQNSKVRSEVINEPELNRIKPKFSKVEESSVKAFNEESKFSSSSPYYEGS